MNTKLLRFIAGSEGDEDIARAIFSAAHEIDKLQAEVERLRRIEVAFNDWHNKTEWVQVTANSSELGMHRADVMTLRINRLTQQLDRLEQERDQLKAAVSLAVDAFKRYEMDVETYPTIDHIKMMRNLNGVLAKHDAEVIERLSVIARNSDIVVETIFDPGYGNPEYDEKDICDDVADWLSDQASQLRANASAEEN